MNRVGRELGLWSQPKISEHVKFLKTCKNFENIGVIVWMWICWVVGSWQTVSFIPRRNSNKTRQCFHSLPRLVSPGSHKETSSTIAKKSKSFENISPLYQDVKGFLDF